MEQNQKQSKKTLIIVTTVISFLILGIGGYFYYKFTNEAKDYDKERIKSEETLSKIIAARKEKKAKDQAKTAPTITEPSTNDDRARSEKESSAPQSSSSGCESQLTDSDRTEIAVWTTFNNPTYNYSFKYVSTWNESHDNDEQINLQHDEGNISFQFRSGRLAEFGVDPNYEQESSENVTLACVSATKTVFIDNVANRKLILTSFDKNGTHFVILMTFNNLGASFSGDAEDTYDLILKTIEFV